MKPPLVESHRVLVGGGFAMSFERTLRVPDDGGTYPLPAGLGALPVRSVASLHAGALPADWHQFNAVIVPLYQCEALWLGFETRAGTPNAVKVGVGKINAVSGERWDDHLRGNPRDYLVCPNQGIDTWG
jgi:hypothetical protein